MPCASRYQNELAKPDSAYTAGGRKASVIAQQYDRGERIPKDGVDLPDRHPNNEEIAKAVQQKVAVRACRQCAGQGGSQCRHRTERGKHARLQGEEWQGYFG